MRSSLFILTACIMLVGAPLLTSCAKEDNEAMAMGGCEASAKAITSDMVTSIEGTATDENGIPVELDNLEELLVAALNEAINGGGSVAQQKSSTTMPRYQIEEVEGTATDEQGNPIEASNLNELLEASLNEALK